MRRFALPLLLLSALPCGAAVFEVDSSADSGPGTLRAALQALDAHPGADEQHDIVFRLPPGEGQLLVLSPLPTINRRFVRLIGQPVIDPGERPTLSAFDGSLLHLGSAVEEVEVRDLNLQNAHSVVGGACLEAAALTATAQLLVQNVVFRSCIASSDADGAFVAGGAIRARGQVTVADSFFEGNEVQVQGASASGRGGAIALLAGTLTVQDTELRDNDVYTFADDHSQDCAGGAIAVDAGSLTLLRTDINAGLVECGSLSRGGGVATSGTSLDIRGSRFRDLLAAVGGAVYVGNRTLGAASEVRIENSLFLANRAWDYLSSDAVASGGALWLTSASDGQPVIRMRNTTFVGNRSQFGEAAHLGGSSGRFDAAHSLLLGPVENSEDGSPGQACAFGSALQFDTAPSHSLAPDSSCAAFPAIATVPPSMFGLFLIVPAGSGPSDVRLLPGSPAIDAGAPQAPAAGVPAACTISDIEGRTRPLDGDGDGVARCDIGAEEFEDPTLFRDGFEP